jgi:glycosyltransferase involved in cell wall biosynthesis
MATTPYFILSPATVLSALGFMRGPDPTPPTPAEDWRTATVDVIIPALNEEDHIVLCLASVLRQTLRPRKIILVDDGSTDRTVETAEAFCTFHNVDLLTIRRRKPIGKTPTIKRQSRELDSDVEFILDADTVLESDNYIERAVQELYQGVGIASACGTILPLRKKDRQRFDDAPMTRRFRLGFPSTRPQQSHQWLHDLATGVTNLYREVLYLFLQRFVYRGQMVFFGTTTNPVGCAVAYRRRYVQRLFDHFGPLLGDDLTNSEDIFIGMAMLNEGYRNIQLVDVRARTVEPEVQRLPKQIYLWSSAFLQSCYYFDPLLKSPFKALKRRLTGRWRSNVVGARPRATSALAYAGVPRSLHLGDPLAYSISTGGGTARATAGRSSAEFADAAVRNRTPRSQGSERRLIGEPYRQGFGRDRTLQYGRPAGWMLMMSAVEKVFFPTALVIMIILGNWQGLALTIAAEALIGVLLLAAVMKGHRLEYLAKGLAVVPIRYALMTSELVTLTRFASDLWITNNRKWRK